MRTAEVDALTARIVALRDEAGRTISIGISGIDCAGKSTLAGVLCARLKKLGIPVLLVPGDGFTPPTAERYADPDPGLGYYRDGFDYTWLFAHLLPAVRSGLTGELVGPVSDWERDCWREASFALEPHAVVIVEGCFLFVDGREDAFDLRVWLELPLEQSVERALRRPRDLERMGGPAGVRERYALRYVPGQRHHLEHDAPQSRSDVVIDAGG